MPAEVSEQKQGALHVKPGTEWAAVLGRASRIAPDAFGTDRLHNLINGTWRATGDPEVLISPVDGSKDTYTCKEGKWVKTACLN